MSTPVNPNRGPGPITDQQTAERPAKFIKVGGGQNAIAAAFRDVTEVRTDVEAETELRHKAPHGKISSQDLASLPMGEEQFTTIQVTSVSTGNSEAMTPSNTPAFSGTAGTHPPESELNKKLQLEAENNYDLRIDTNLSDKGDVKIDTKSVSSANRVSAYTSDLLKACVGGQFRPTSQGAQEVSDDVLIMNDRVKYHISIPSNDPKFIHISFYPKDDKEYKNKILHCNFRWNNDNKEFKPEGQIRAKWKPYTAELLEFPKEAGKIVTDLQAKLREKLL